MSRDDIEKSANGECFIVGKRLSWSIILLVLVQFASIIWFARGLETRLCNLESSWLKKEPAIDRLDVIEFRQGKIAEMVEKMRDSQIRIETTITELRTNLEAHRRDSGMKK